ncbi:MAG: hypothetical protein AAF141_01640 [Pseudomonadota bacterium]
MITVLRTVAAFSLAVTLAACSEEDTGPQGVKIVPVFGPDRIDISKDVDWFSTRVGVIESEQFDDKGNIIGMAFASRINSLGPDDSYPAIDGELGVKLVLGGYSHFSKHTLPSSQTAGQVLQIAIQDTPRFVLDAQGLQGDTLTELTIESVQFGSTTSTTGWSNNQGAHYLNAPGQYTVSLVNVDTGESHSQDINLGTGETAEIKFSFGN